MSVVMDYCALLAARLVQAIPQSPSRKGLSVGKYPCQGALTVKFNTSRASSTVLWCGSAVVREHFACTDVITNVT